MQFGVSKRLPIFLITQALNISFIQILSPTPTIENVQHGVAEFKASKADCIVAIGGGSSMDTAKAIGIIIANPGI